MTERSKKNKKERKDRKRALKQLAETSLYGEAETIAAPVGTVGVEFAYDENIGFYPASKE